MTLLTYMTETQLGMKSQVCSILSSMRHLKSQDSQLKVLVLAKKSVKYSILGSAFPKLATEDQTEDQSPQANQGRRNRRRALHGWLFVDCMASNSKRSAYYVLRIQQGGLAQPRSCAQETGAARHRRWVETRNCMSETHQCTYSIVKKTSCIQV